MLRATAHLCMRAIYMCVCIKYIYIYIYIYIYTISVFSDLVRIPSLPSTSEPPVVPTRASARFIAMCRKGGRPAGRAVTGNRMRRTEKERQRRIRRRSKSHRMTKNSGVAGRDGRDVTGRDGTGRDGTGGRREGEREEGAGGGNDGTCERRSERGGDPRAIMLYSVLVRLPAGYLRRRRLTARVFRDTVPSARKNVRLSSRRPVSSLTVRSARSFLSSSNGEKARNESARRNERHCTRPCRVEIRAVSTEVRARRVAVAEVVMPVPDRSWIFHDVSGNGRSHHAKSRERERERGEEMQEMIGDCSQKMLELKVRVDTLARTASGNMGSARDTCMRRTFVIRRTSAIFPLRQFDIAGN